jgi:hypothetical protein
VVATAVPRPPPHSTATIGVPAGTRPSASPNASLPVDSPPATASAGPKLSSPEIASQLKNASSVPAARQASPPAGAGRVSTDKRPLGAGAAGQALRPPPGVSGPTPIPSHSPSPGRRRRSPGSPSPSPSSLSSPGRSAVSPLPPHKPRRGAGGAGAGAALAPAAAGFGAAAALPPPPATPSRSALKVRLLSLCRRAGATVCLRRPLLCCPTQHLGTVVCRCPDRRHRGLPAALPSSLARHGRSTTTRRPPRSASRWDRP